MLNINNKDKKSLSGDDMELVEVLLYLTFDLIFVRRNKHTPERRDTDDDLCASHLSVSSKNS